MASSYSTDLKLELMVTGENAGTWGDKTNTNLNLVQQAIAGFEQVTLSAGGTTALVMSDGALSNARNLVIKFATITATSGTICTIPDSIEKFYIFDVTGVTNPTNLTIKTASGTGFTPDAQKIYAAYADGTNLNEVSLDTLGGSIGTAQVADSAVTTAKIADDAVTSAKIADDAVVAAAIADDAVVTAAIADNAVATANIADDAVTADKLANTSVTAGSYTLASITVDAQGRLTAASSGTAGGAGFLLVNSRSSGQSGTHTSPGNTSTVMAFMCAGSGGGGSNSNCTGSPRAGGGGPGGMGCFTAPISQPFSASFSVGTSGNAGGGRGAGNAGTATTFHNFTVNGGGGGSAGENPSQSSQQGATGTAVASSGTVVSDIVAQYGGSKTNLEKHFVQTSAGGGVNSSGNGGGSLFIYEA
jgi:hypothetical protein